MATKLRFFAAGTALVRIPYIDAVHGQSPEYVGRTPVEVDGVVTYPATGVHECTGAAAHRLAKLARRDGTVIPADEATARACRLPFVPHEIRDGVVVPVAANKPRNGLVSGAGAAEK